MQYDFDQILDRSQLATMKWEYEYERTGWSDLLCYGTADMDFRSAPEIINALVQTAHTGHYGYPHRPQAYFDAIIGYYQRHFNWRVERTWIQPHASVYAAMVSVIQALTSVGDEVIFQSPVHHIFEEIITLNHRVAVANPLVNTNGRYHMDYDHLRRCITPRTKLLLLCSPHNPVGRIWSAIELQTLVDICVANGITILADEVYCGLLFPGQTFTPLSMVSQTAAHHSITFMSASKSFNLTGLKHAFTISENPTHTTMSQMAARRAAMGYGVSQFGVVAAEVAFRDGDAWNTALMHYVAETHQFVQDFFATHLPAVRVTRPESTYMLWLDFNALALPHDTLHTFFEQAAHIIVLNGAGYGPGGRGFVRMNIGAPRAVIAQGLERIVAACTNTTRLE